MNNQQDPIRLLMSGDSARQLTTDLSRRRLFGIVGGSAALAAFLAACGDDSKSGSKDTTAPGGSGDAGANSFKLFTWAEYDDPDLLKSFGNIEITIFNSNEEAVQKLVAAGGNGGFDMICPTGPFVPQFIGEKLLAELDLTRLTNFANIDPLYTNQVFDPGNKHSVCKDWGSTGWIYDKTVISREIKTWADFIDVAMNEASGKVSVLDSAVNLFGMYAWANGISWTTTDPAELAAAEDFLVNEFAPHIKAFDSYPGINLTQGNYALSMAWNGDARQGLIAVEAAGGNPDDYQWALGTPTSELWMDNWCILEGASNVDACYNFINFILDPKNSATDVLFHGYNTGIKGVKDLLPSDAKYLDMVFFDDAAVATMVPGSLDNLDAVVDIINKTKASAGA